MKFQLILLSITLLVMTACTPEMVPSGMHTTDGSYLQGPANEEEAKLVDSELATQRATRRSGHGFTYQADPGRVRCWGYGCGGYHYHYYHRYHW